MEVSFTSAFRPIPQKEFSILKSGIPKNCFVDFPWTMSEAVKGSSACTDRVCDCSVLGITDGAEVFLSHLNPENESNRQIFALREHIARNVDLFNENLQAVLIGSKNTKKSLDLYGKLKGLLEEFNIKYSQLRNSKTPLSVVYSSNTDEWRIASAEIDKKIRKGLSSEQIFTSSFENVSLADFDEIV